MRTLGPQKAAEKDLMRALLKEIEALPTLTRFGRVARIEGLGVEVTGAVGAVTLGGQVRLSLGNSKKISCEVVGFRDGRALVMPLGPLDGISLGARADFENKPASIYPSKAWLGRVLNGFGVAIDGAGMLPQGAVAYPLKAAPPLATSRARVGAKLDLGIRALNTFATCCLGQRYQHFGQRIGPGARVAPRAGMDRYRPHERAELELPLCHCPVPSLLLLGNR